MYIFKKITATMLAAIMLGSILWTPTLEAAGNNSVVDGSCSECATEWTLDITTGKVVISGNGDMCGKCSYEWESYKDKIKTVEIKSGVTAIGEHAFEGCSALTSITIPESVTHIGASAFENTGYFNTDSNWEDGVLYIGKWLIQAKESITGRCCVKDGTKGIADSAFIWCSELVSITIPESVTEIGVYVFYYCSSLTSIEMPEGVTKIGSSTFSCCSSLTSVEIPEGVTSIDGGAFEECSALANITIPKSVTKIGYFAFNKCRALTSITIPESVTEIGGHAFQYCSSLTSITIPEGVTIIENDVFYGCSALMSVIIPKSVTMIGYSAFSACNDLMAVYYTGSKTEWDAIQIGKGNTALEEATIYYNSVMCAHESTSVVKKKMATFSDDGYSGDTICSACKVVIKKGKSIKKISFVKLSKPTYTYSGKVQHPVVTVKDSAGKALKKNTDYTVKYSGNGKSVGKYTVTITFKGNYKGTKTVSYTINPKSTGLKYVTTGSKAFTVKWNKQTKEVTGYQIRYSLKKNMSGSKTTTIKNTKTTSCKIKKLKANKKYYVQIRTYKTAGGKTYYSTWSKAKTVTTKK